MNVAIGSVSFDNLDLNEEARNQGSWVKKVTAFKRVGSDRTHKAQAFRRLTTTLKVAKIKVHILAILLVEGQLHGVAELETYNKKYVPTKETQKSWVGIVTAFRGYIFWIYKGSFSKGASSRRITGSHAI
ncbi:OLC1v1028011C1 [Oldenlandia corymbosa var. corymbosa]|uniref:OLC1v1028011C1 n=1 Tax=Oldenlandia corymbosa var. corymbosa TaxID=529605 RepID=A0AAV1CDG3_OLDCO|nr:OLC1v1028011C1 [Oldenlandia corymbosa var. corymbosa]